jgi:hypothetical protein
MTGIDEVPSRHYGILLMGIVRVDCGRVNVPMVPVMMAPKCRFMTNCRFKLLVRCDLEGRGGAKDHGRVAGSTN